MREAARPLPGRQRGGGRVGLRSAPFGRCAPGAPAVSFRSGGGLCLFLWYVVLIGANVRAHVYGYTETEEQGKREPTVKDDHLVRAGNGVEEKALNFGVVILLNGVVVCERGLGGRRLVLDDLESIGVESK